MRKTTKHAVYTIEEKNKIVEKYLNGEMGYKKITRYYDLGSRSKLSRWVKEYRELGTLKDNRGKSAKKGISGRKKKLIPEQMTREELIQYVNAVEDIKKLMVCLRQQKKNIK